MKWTFRDIIEVLFLPLLTAICVLIYDLSKNVNAVNVQMGIIITNQTNQKATDERQDKEIDGLKADVKQMWQSHKPKGEG